MAMQDRPSDDLATTITDAVEEVLVTIIETIRERPAVVAALLAGILGTTIGLALAGRGRKQPPVERARKAGMGLLGGMADAVDFEERSRRVSKRLGRSTERVDKKSGGLLSRVMDLRSAADLVPLAMQLMENPIVRTYLQNTVAKQVQKRFK
ncbi:MAG: hypothetical protein HYX52_02515 [Chloroflexi bacterium]|nr:hypothetical protein [Chloroflexota bacterium]